MLTKQTVFILGAGASVGYGLVAGEGLLAKARNLDEARLLEVAGPHVPGADQDSAPRLHSALQRTLDSSIDAVLELRPDITPLGKRVLAYLMLQEEQALINFPHDCSDDWIAYLFRELAREADTIDRFFANQFTFITFNYDRVVEYKLVHGLAEHYGRGLKFDEMLRKLPSRLIHLHGDLGLLPELDPNGAIPIGGIFGSASGPRFQPQYVHSASQRIQIVHEADTSAEQFVRARDALKRADQVCLLGFGFGEKNLQRLHIRDWAGHAALFATCYDMAKTERRLLAEEPFASVPRPIKLVDMKLRPFFREHLDILRA